MNDILHRYFEPEAEKPSAAAIGAFDGIHLGHQHILKAMSAYAKSRNLISTAILFDPLPSQFFGRLGPNDRILLKEEQTAFLTELGIDRIIVIPFTKEIADLSPEAFLSAMQNTLHCEKLFMGEDFSIGKGRSGDPKTLATLGRTFGFSTEIIPKDMLDGDVISSTRIRTLLHEGKIREANHLLGYPFYFSGSIIHGAARGRKLGFPTLNVQIPQGKIILPNGVYAVYNVINGVKYASVTNIGVRPTFGLEDQGVFVESYLLDASGDFYGKESTLEIIEMLRPEICFESADALRDQISQDIESAKSILS